MDTTFYNAVGSPVAYTEDGTHIFSFDGTPIAYLKGSSVYSYDGRHLGWFEEGWVRDRYGRYVLCWLLDSSMGICGTPQADARGHPGFFGDRSADNAQMRGRTVIGRGSSQSGFAR